MWVSEVMSGLNYDNFPRIMTFENKFEAAGMVVEKDVQSMSLCSHHLVTIDGSATVAYIPNEKVIGLSKINRVVEFFSRRPQEAERLTLQIFYALEYILGTSDIAVMIEAEHLCVSSRGVEDTSASTVTSKLGGGFKTDSAARAEFFQLARK
jgi:GTP cyclohydrolase I